MKKTMLEFSGIRQGNKWHVGMFRMVNPASQALLPELWEVLGDLCYWPQAAEGDTRGLQSTFGLGS